uniref:Slc6a-5 n=1 Tax=Schmidtea mediterranea TaxID=79327 RepID=A0A0H3YEX4_SCHMD|nr:slc6a-5 [Schmidtea mediterranea]
MASVEDSSKTNEQVISEVDSQTPKTTARGNWSGRFDFFLSCVGYAVGLGNLWRFPHLCYIHGGGAFLVPYFIMLLIAGIPIFYFELALGQFSSSGPISIWKVQPMFKGIGYSMLIVATIVSVYYNVIIAWSLYYLFASFTSKLPWSDCNNAWNDERCLTDFRNKTISNCSTLNTQNCIEYEVAAEQYWKKVVLGVEDYAGNLRPMEPFLGPVQWHLCLCLLLAWIICGACLIKGVKSSGKVVYFTAIFPYVVIIIMVVNGCLLSGSKIGIQYYLIPKWKKLLSIQVWRDAATQIFYSLGVAFGGLMTMSSYNKFNNNCYRDALLVSVINCLTSFLAGFAIFSVLGYMAHQTGRAIEQTTTSGSGLAFVAYAQSLSTMKVAPLWSILFFLMLLTLGIDSQFGGMEAIFTGLQDEFPILKKTHFIDIAFKISVQIILFFLGITCVSKGGIYMFSIMDEYSGTFTLQIIAIFELITIMYLYGVKNFMKDIKMMLGFKPGYYWVACWMVVTPLTIIFILILSFMYHTPTKFGNYILPVWANVLGYLMTLVGVINIVVYFIYYAIFKGVTKTPKDSWGPGNKADWEIDDRYAVKSSPCDNDKMDSTSF